MKRFRRIATLMLAIIMAASTVVIPSYAESNIQYSESDLHELIDYDMAVDAGHVNRLNDEEDLNTLIFANEDNTKTMYFYGEDIKYTDEFGVIRDKTNKLTSTATGYTNADNDISIHLPNTLSDGITIDYEDISLMLIPAVSELPDHIEADDVATSRGEADYVVYDDVFGTKTSLKYTPMYSGLKEDIILEEYTGVSEFQFFLYTGGLELDEVDNEYVLLDGEDTVAQLSQVFIYDSEYNTAVGSMIVTPIKDDQIYAITVCADVDFLTASSTVYPVTVDPTIEIKHNAVTIDDAILSAAYPTSNFGSSDTLMVGGNYQAYTALRFMGLNNNSTFSLLSAAQITGAMLHLTCTSKGSTTATVYVNQYAPTSTSSGWWTESGITYSGNGVNINSSIIGSSKTISTVSTHSISIINIVKAWADSTSLIEQGLLLRLSDSQYGNSNCYAYFASSEYSAPTTRPYISINYVSSPATGYYLIQNAYTSNYLAVDGEEQGNGIDVGVFPESETIAEYEINNSSVSSNVIIIDYYWRVVVSEGSYELKSLIDQYGYGKGLSTNLKISTSSTSWSFVYAGNDKWYIKSGSNYLTDNSGVLELISYNGSSKQQWQLTSQSTFTRTIQVTNSSGVAVSGATIQISATNMPERKQNHSATTNSSGIATLELLSGYYYGVNVVHNSYSKCYAADYFNSSGTTTITIRSIPSYIIAKSFSSPLSPKERTSSFGCRSRYTSFTDISDGEISFGVHKGVDYIGNSNILSICEGDVVETQSPAIDSRGIYVTVRYYSAQDSSKYIDITYKHLASYIVDEGDHIEEGDNIGIMGGTGYPKTYPVHLHIDIKDQNGVYYDPEAFFS